MIDSRPHGDHTAYFGMLRRMLKAATRRVANGDPYDLAELVALRESMDQAIAEAVKAQRAAGWSWAEIAEPLNMTRQNAFQRWGRS